MAADSATGKIDIVAHSYSAFELSIVFEHDTDGKLRDVVDSVLLVSPTKVRTGAFDGVDVTVLYEADDVVPLAPVAPRLGRLDHAKSILGARVLTVDVNADGHPIRQAIVQHDSWMWPGWELHTMLKPHLRDL